MNQLVLPKVQKEAGNIHRCLAVNVHCAVICSGVTKDNRVTFTGNYHKLYVNKQDSAQPYERSHAAAMQLMQTEIVTRDTAAQP